MGRVGAPGLRVGPEFKALWAIFGLGCGIGITLAFRNDLEQVSGPRSHIDADHHAALLPDSASAAMSSSPSSGRLRHPALPESPLMWPSQRRLPPGAGV